MEEKEPEALTRAAPAPKPSRPTGGKGSFSRRNRTVFPWLPFVLLLVSIYVFWIYPQQHRPKPVKVIFLGGSSPANLTGTRKAATVSAPVGASNGQAQGKASGVESEPFQSGGQGLMSPQGKMLAKKRTPAKPIKEGSNVQTTQPHNSANINPHP